MADYERARDWGSYICDWETNTNVEAKRRRLMEDQDTATQNTAPLEGETQETQEEESNIIRGNRIGSRL